MAAKCPHCLTTLSPRRALKQDVGGLAHVICNPADHKSDQTSWRTLRLLLGSPTIRELAEVCNVSHASMREWLGKHGDRYRSIIYRLSIAKLIDLVGVEDTKRQLGINGQRLPPRQDIPMHQPLSAKNSF